MKVISSKNNETYKFLVKVSKKSNVRKKNQKFIVEGLKEINLCINSNYKIDSFYTSNKNFDFKNLNNNCEKKYVLTKDLMESITYRSTSQIIALVYKKKYDINKVKLSKNELVLILEKPEKPGNIGAIFRTFNASGFKNIIISESSTEIYNPNVIRSSLGAVFCLNIFELNKYDILSFLKENNFIIYSSFIRSKNIIQEINFKKRCAILMGTESSSISDFYLKNSHSTFKIPMCGDVDSLNLSVSTSIILYEAMNQRKSINFISE